METQEQVLEKKSIQTNIDYYESLPARIRALEEKDRYAGQTL